MATFTEFFHPLGPTAIIMAALTGVAVVVHLVASRSAGKTVAVLFCIAILTFCASLLIGKVCGGTRIADLTQQKLYTLSPGTLNIIEHLPGPVTLKFYYSQTAVQKGPEQLRTFENYHYYVRDLLEEYARKSGGKLKVEYIDPRPFSDEEEQALTDGVTRLPMGGDEYFFFGLTATNEYGRTKAIEIFSPERQEFVEYDISKLICDLMQREKRKVGVLSPSLPVLGPPDMTPEMMMMMRYQGRDFPKPWLIAQQLGQTYERRQGHR